MANLLTEFIGTFFLVLVIGLALFSQTPVPGLAIGSALMVMVYMGGHVSGAHYNPAVTLAVAMRGKLPGRDVIPYMAAQLAGAVVAGLAARLFTGRNYVPAPGDGVGVGIALLVELLFTFALALVVLNAATASRTEGNSFYGLAIGFTVFAAAASAGGISGGAFNPAVSLGPALVDAALGSGSLRDVWIYLVGPFLGGALAALVFRVQNPRDVAALVPEGGTLAGDFPVPRPKQQPH